MRSEQPAAPGYPRAEVTGVVLAGGRARRMGGRDKGLVEVAGLPMAVHVARALHPQVGSLLLNANRNAAEYARITGCRVIADRVGEFAGPLAGMASAMQAAATPWLLTAPCDSPLIAPDLGPRLHAALADADARIAVATDGERLQPVFALLHCGLLADLVEYLDSGERKIDRWYARHRTAEVLLADRAEMFLNINTPGDRERLEQRLRALPGEREC